MEKKFIILVFGFDDYQVNFVTVRPGESNYSISYMREFAYEYEHLDDAYCAIRFIESRIKGLRFEIVEPNSINHLYIANK